MVGGAPVGGATVGAAVGGAALGGTVGLGGPLGGAVAPRMGPGVGGSVGGASVGSGLAAATGPRDATGMSSPPRPATKVIANTALAATKRADAKTAGVSVRAGACPVGPSNPLLAAFAGPGL
jgi:hypothetical protein